MRAISVAAFGVLVWAGFAQPALADENPKPRAAARQSAACGRRAYALGIRDAGRQHRHDQIR